MVDVEAGEVQGGRKRDHHDADRIIWSVDYPYLALDGTRAFIENLPVSHEDREMMTHLNAEKLFGL